LSDEIYCPPDQAVLLASYAMQAKYGDYSKVPEIIIYQILFIKHYSRMTILPVSWQMIAFCPKGFSTR
jgi:hypothetical protein